MLLLNKVLYTCELIPIPVDTVRWSPLDSPLWTLHSRRVQYGIVRWTPLDPSLWTTVNIYSSRIWQSPLDPPCDNLWHLDSRWVQWNPADRVGQCKVLTTNNDFATWKLQTIFIYQKILNGRKKYIKNFSTWETVFLFEWMKELAPST